MHKTCWVDCTLGSPAQLNAYTVHDAPARIMYIQYAVHDAPARIIQLFNF